MTDKAEEIDTEEEIFTGGAGSEIQTPSVHHISKKTAVTRCVAMMRLKSEERNKNRCIFQGEMW